MPAVLRMIDEAPGQPPREVGSLHLVSERVTAGDIIRRRVEAEIAAYQGASGGVFPGLVQPAGSEPMSGGFRVKPGQALDAGEQTRVALEAFARNRILMLFDDRQIESAEEVLTVTPGSTVTFIRLVPLVGG